LLFFFKKKKESHGMIEINKQDYVVVGGSRACVLVF